jgi:spore germination protein Q
MNINYYTQPIFPGNAMPSATPNQQFAPTIDQSVMPVGEQSYIENIFRLNKEKLVKVFMSFPDSVEWRDKIFTGTIEASGRDHLIIADQNTGLRYLLPIIYTTNY